MCNLYSLSKHMAGVREMVRAMTPEIGNFPPLPGIFPDYSKLDLTRTSSVLKDDMFPFDREWAVEADAAIEQARKGLLA